jgi:ribonuclease BN (tRNA processing enzyme)
MEIIFLGTASGIPVPNRNAAAVYIGGEDNGFLLDVGEGTAKQLISYGLSPERICSIFISHTHADHAAGIFALIQSFHLMDRKHPLNLFLPQGVLPKFADAFPLFQIYLEKWDFKINIHPLTDGIITRIGQVQIKGIKNEHLKDNQKYAEIHGLKAEAYSFYIQDKDRKGIIYTSDIPSLDHLRAEVTNTQVLISECTHISIEKIKQFASNANIPRVLLTHIPPEKENIQLEKSGKLELNFAYDGLRIEV